MIIRTFTAIAGAFLFAIPAANAEHTTVGACGGSEINRDEGYRDGRVVTRDMENRIEEFLQDSDALPGAGIAIVKDSRIVYLRGFGFRDLDGCIKATSDTRYYLKSATKNFLGAAAAALHEEGRIELDAPISEYLPDLKFPDGLRPEQTSIRAHLTHTQPYFDSGLNYVTAFPGNLPEEEFIAHANKFSESKDIRFRYSNFGPIMAAHAIGEKTGLNWRDFIREKVFKPAGMTNSFTSMAEAEQGPMAQGYVGAYDPDFEPTLTKTDSQMHAAGGSVSTVADLARWLILNLEDGVIDGQQAISKRAMKQAHARQVQLDLDYYEFHRFAHGLGVYHADYDGDNLMHHFGGETHLSFMPERGMGVVVLTNELGFGSRVTHALAASIYDMLLKKPDLNERITRRLGEIDSAKTQFAERLEQYLAKVRETAPDAPPVFSADDLIGQYKNDRMGDMSIVSIGNGLVVIYGAIESPLEYLGGDKYLAGIGLWNAMPPQVFDFREDTDFGFVLDWDGRIFVKQD